MATTTNKRIAETNSTQSKMSVRDRGARALRDGRGSTKSTYWAWVLLVWAIGFLVALFWIDEIVCRFVTVDQMPGDVKKMFNMFELFGHGTGVGMICLLVFVLDTNGKLRSRQLLMTGIVTGVVVITLKTLFVRVRPSIFLQSVAGNDWVTTAISVEAPWSRCVAAEHGFFHDAVHSFPSGHVATAFAMAYCMAHFYPKGKFVFLSFAMMVAAQRIIGQAHYVSDTFAGAAVGTLVAIALKRLWLHRVKSSNARNSIQDAALDHNGAPSLKV